MPNSWSYVLEQPGGWPKLSQEKGAASDSSRPTSPLAQGSTKHHPASLITKVLSQEELAMVSCLILYLNVFDKFIS